MVEWVVEPFGKQHDRDGFTCGKPPLDDFIRARVSQYEKRRLGKTFVAVTKGEPKILGVLHPGSRGCLVSTSSHRHVPQTAKAPGSRRPVSTVGRRSVRPRETTRRGVTTRRASTRTRFVRRPGCLCSRSRCHRRRRGQVLPEIRVFTAARRSTSPLPPDRYDRNIARLATLPLFVADNSALLC